MNEVEVEAVTLTVLDPVVLNVNEVGLSVRPLLPLPPPLLELPLTDTTTGTTTEVLAALVANVTFAVLRPFARVDGSIVTMKDPGVVVALPLTVTQGCDDVAEEIGKVDWSLALTTTVELLQPVPPEA